MGWDAVEVVDVAVDIGASPSWNGMVTVGVAVAQWAWWVWIEA